MKTKKSIFFSWNCIFGSFKLFSCSKIDFWPFLKLQKRNLVKKNFVKLIYLISRVFGLDFFNFSGPLCSGLFMSSKTRWVVPISTMPWKLLEWYAINYFPNEIQQHKIAESIHQIQFISWSCVRDELPTQFGSFPFQSGGLSVSEAHGMPPWGVYDQGVSPQTQSSGGSNLIRLNSETLFFLTKKSFWIEK